MRNSKKFLSMGLSFLLMFSLAGVAYADPVDENAAGQEYETLEDIVAEDSSDAFLEEDGAVDLVDPEDSLEESDREDVLLDDPEASSNDLETEAIGDEEESEATEQEDAIEQDEDSLEAETKEEDPLKEQIKKADAAELIEYVFIDSNLISLGETQNIAYALLDANATIASAEAEFVRGDTEETITLSAQTMVGNAALFTKTFTGKEEATSYQLQSITYTVEGSDEQICADFTVQSENQEGGTYIFDVVSEEVAEAFSAANTSEDMSAFALDESGEFVAVESMEEAIEVADIEGVNNFEEGDSIVDAEALAANEETEDSEIIDENGEESSEESIVENIVTWFTPEQAYAAASKAREGYLIVALDPGHGGSDPGATNAKLNLKEKDLNLKIAKACKTELSKYTGISVVMTRSDDTYVGLEQRVEYAKKCHADVFVSIHINSSGNGSARGAEVWVPNTSSYLYSSTHVEGKELGTKIVNQLASLGLVNRGVKTRDLDGQKYSDGSRADYYSVIRNSRKAGFPGIIVEHAFIDNADDGKYLGRDSFLTNLGKADARGIVSQYGLVTDASAKTNATVKYRSFISYVGWQSFVYDQKVSGTTGKSTPIQTVSMHLQSPSTSGSIQYRSSVVNAGWQGWKTDGATSGIKGEKIQALQIKLTGKMASTYDVYYRVHVANVGWLGWAKNGASAGSAGYGYDAQAYEVVLVKKGEKAPGSTATPFKSKADEQAVKYQTHVQNVGWQAWKINGATSGTSGKSLRLEGIKISLSNQNYSGNIQYRTHVQNLGWQSWVNNGALSGTSGKSLRLEAIQLKLSGDMASKYDIYYRVHAENFGWMGWAKNGQSAGTAGWAYRLEAIQIKLVAKGGAAPGSTNNRYREKGTTTAIRYQAHVQSIGWQGERMAGGTAGTSGRSLRVEGIKIHFYDQRYTGGVQYRTHIQNIGWQGWKSDGALSGTTGRSLRLEAIQIKLTGKLAENYDIYYRAHVQNVGWTGWAKNGASAGSSGYSYRMEAIQIKLVAKNGKAPGETSNTYISKGGSTTPAPTNGTPIMGSSKTSVAQMVRRYNAMGKTYPSSVYKKYGASNITQFCTIIFEEAKAEGVRAEVVFAQTMHETGWLQFGGDVKATQCNFAGLGATGGVPGNSFPNVRTGLRAQVQHLKCYASTANLKNENVDPRWNGVVATYGRGSAPTVEALSKKWATGADYGEALKGHMNDLLRA